MTNNNNTPSEEKEPKKVVLTWSSTMKPSVYDIRELPAIRKKRTDGQLGYVYYNSHRNSWELPRSISMIEPPKRNSRK
jgi:hypothetical protein